MKFRTIHTLVLALAAYVAVAEARNFSQPGLSPPIQVAFQETLGNQVTVDLRCASSAFCASQPKFEIQVEPQAQEIHIFAFALPGVAPKNILEPSRAIHRKLNVGRLPFGTYRVFYWEQDHRTELAGFTHHELELVGSARSM